VRSFLYIGFFVFYFGLFPVDQSEAPLFFELPVEFDETLQKSSVGEFMEDGFIAPVSIELVSDEGNPLFYSSSIRTTVCDDEICEIMYVKLYWDLVGEYVGFDTLVKHPLTKFDHEPFTHVDYERLHELLKNEGSILKFKQKDELIDKEKVRASDVVDGTTGATSVEIKKEVVEGALYSSYTLWHLAYNGKVKNMITEQTALRIDDQLLKQLLNSSRSGYKLFAFHNFEEKEYQVYRKYWLSALKNDMPLTRKYILNNLPEKIWNTKNAQEDVCALFSYYDVNTKTYLLNKLKKTANVSARSLEYISDGLTDLNSNQTKQFLSLVRNRKEITPNTKSNIAQASDNKNFKYSYLIDEYERNK